MPESKKQKGADDSRSRLQAAFEGQAPTFYFNSFVNAMGTGDVTIVLEQNNRPVAVLNTSFTVAKTLAEKLGGVISSFEKDTGTIIMTTDDVITKTGLGGK